MTDAARLNLNDLKEYPYHRLLQIPVARAIAAQIVLGVQFIHSQGIVHGGTYIDILISTLPLHRANLSTDLHPGNILLQLPPDMQNMTLEQFRAKTRDPETEPVVREDGAPLDPGVPSELVIPIWLGVDSDKATLADGSIMIADFGEAFDPRDKNEYTCHTPLLLAPPEARFTRARNLDEPMSFPGDVWTIACTIWDVF